MYTYPNPLNYKLEFFHLRHIFVIKKHDLDNISAASPLCTELIVRDDKFDNSFQYTVVDRASSVDLPLQELPVRRDIFRDCKNRKPKSRTASMPHLPE